MSCSYTVLSVLTPVCYQSRQMTSQQQNLAAGSYHGVRHGYLPVPVAAAYLSGAYARQLHDWK